MTLYINSTLITNLKSLSIYYPPNMVDSHLSEKIYNSYSNLKCLKLKGGIDIPYFLKSMTNVEWNNLEVLSISSDSIKSFDLLPNIYSSISQLKSLSLELIGKNDEMVNPNIIEYLSQLTSLEELDISKINTDENYLINNFQHFNKMKILKLKCINPSNSELFIKHVNSLTNLIELSLEYVPDIIYMNKSFLNYLPNLQYLMIDGLDQMKCTYLVILLLL